MQSDTRSDLTLSDSTALRFLMVFLLYVAQGAPVGVFFFALPAWLAANGASAVEVGTLLTATSLPWSLKFVNGFLMDRFTFLPMGRRRIWLICAQLIIVATLLVAALLNLGPTQILALSVFAFVNMTATTYQDVAVDGMAVDLIPDAERARANGLMFGGQAIGIAAGTAFTGFAIAALGFSAAMVGNAAFVAIILALLIVIRERPGERLLPWTGGEAATAAAALQVTAWKPLVAQVWKNMISRDSALHVIAQVSQGAFYGFTVGLLPLIAVNVTGWSDAQYSGFSGLANLIGGLMGVFVFGFIADGLGSRRTTMLAAGLLAAQTGVFMLAAPYWSSSAVLLTGGFAFFLTFLCLQIAICASAMKICSLKVAATQFTLFMALANLGITLASALLGPLEALGGYQAVLGAMIVAALVCGTAMWRFNESAMAKRAKADLESPGAAAPSP